MQGKTTTIDDVKNLGTILCIFAHPDDETISMGGIMAQAVMNGQKVGVVTATRGEAGIQDERRWPAERLAEIRLQELAAALSILGVQQHRWLPYADGSCAEADTSAAAAEVAEIIKQFRPDSIFSFGPDGLTGHPDHVAVSAWVVAARNQSAPEARLFFAVETNSQYAKSRAVDSALNVFFNTTKPPTVADADAAICCYLNDELFGTKMRALQAMPSQYQIMFEKFDKLTMHDCFGVEAFVEYNF